MLLERLGAAVRVARDGPAALAAMERDAAAIVLLDIGMPGMDGNEVARRLRAGARDPAPVLIAVTGWGQERDLRRAREAGFDHHLVKPVDLGALRALLEQIGA